jgi:hypothetical protein
MATSPRESGKHSHKHDNKGQKPDPKEDHPDDAHDAGAEQGVDTTVRNQGLGSPPDPNAARSRSSADRESAAQQKREQADRAKASKYPVLPPGQAHQLFYNGHRIARDGDKPSQWISMSRLPDSTAVVMMPMTADLEEEIKGGKFFLADDLVDEPEPPKAPKPDSDDA